MKDINFEPVGDRILIKRTIIDKIGRIIVPKSGKAHEKDEGYIVAIGEDVRQFKIGNYVIFGKFAGMDMRFEGIEGEFTLITEGDIVGIVPKPEKLKVNKKDKNMVELAQNIKPYVVR